MDMLNRKGQNIAEYSILIALVVAAAVAMQVYVRRGLQGRVADAVDHAPAANLGDAGTVDFATKQYEPYYSKSAADVDTKRDYQEQLTERGQTGRTGVTEESRKKTGAYDTQEWQGNVAR
jgi:hypothetical protein